MWQDDEDEDDDEENEVLPGQLGGEVVGIGVF